MGSSLFLRSKPHFFIMGGNASIFQDASHKKFEQASELGKLAYTTDPYQSV